MESGKEAQNNSERGHETDQRHTSDEKAPSVGPRQSVVEGNSAGTKEDGYFSKFGNWVSLLTLLFVAAYTVITFVQWRSNHIFNKKQLRSINAQLSEMRSSSAQTDQTIGILRDQAETAKHTLDVMINSERGRLFIGDIVLKKSNGTDPKPQIEYRWINMGRGPALITEILVDCELLKDSVLTTPTYNTTKARYGQTTLGTGATGGSFEVPQPLPPCVLDKDLSPTDWEAMHDKHEFILFWGRIRYEDAFHRYLWSFGSIYRGDVNFFSTIGLPPAYNGETQQDN